MSTQEDILTPRAQRRRNGQKVQNNTKPVNQANMTYVSDTGDPNDAVRQGVYDNTQQRIEAMSGAQGNPQTIDVQGKGLAPTYGQRQVPQATPLPTAAPTTQAPTQPQQLATSKTGVVQVPQGKPISTQDNGKVSDMVKDKNLTYNDMLAMLTDQKAAEEKRIRREKQAARIATIGQGLSSLANLYYTTKGAPNAFTPELSERMRTKYDQLTKERTANDRAYLQNYITMLERQRNDARIRQRNEITNNYYKTKGDLEAEKQRQEAALKKQQQEFAQELARRKQDEVEKNNAERIRVADERNQTAKQRVNAYIQKNGGTGKNSDGTTNYWVYGPDGKKRYFKNKSQRDVYATELAMNNKDGDTPITEEKIVTTETSDRYGDTKTNTRTSQEKLSGDRITANVNNKYKPTPKGNANKGKGKTSTNTSGKTKVNW